MAVQRKTKNLGLNRSRYREKIFKYIENTLRIKKKICSRGNSKRKIKYNFNHEGPNPLPIRNFNLLDAYEDKKGNVLISSKDGLQANCMACERKFRTGRTNKSKEKYANLTSEEIYTNHKKEWGEFKGCSICDPEKKRIRPEEVPISRGMETGLHNHCKRCSKAYSESVGKRWEIYSPDGHQVIRKNKKSKCVTCGIKKDLEKDHIWPLSKGGTDNKENIQILCGPHNGSKSATIMGFIVIHEIDDKMICERYQNILKKAKNNGWPINKFELDIAQAVKEFIIKKKNMDDRQLRKFFEKEKIKNNRKHSVDRAIKNFRKYCKTAILEIGEYIEKNN